MLREKCPNMESFLVRIFLYSDLIQENMDQKKLRIGSLFTQWLLSNLQSTKIKRYQLTEFYKAILLFSVHLFYINIAFSPFLLRNSNNSFQLSNMIYFSHAKTIALFVMNHYTTRYSREKNVFQTSSPLYLTPSDFTSWLHLIRKQGLEKYLKKLTLKVSTCQIINLEIFQYSSCHLH